MQHSPAFHLREVGRGLRWQSEIEVCHYHRRGDRERNEEVAWSNAHYIFASRAAAAMKQLAVCILMRYKPKCAASKWDDDGLAADASAGYF